jgi:hypothetical protein
MGLRAGGIFSGICFGVELEEGWLVDFGHACGRGAKEW